MKHIHFAQRTPLMRVPSMGGQLTLVLFGGAALLMFGVAYGFIPFLSGITGYEPIVFWFVGAGAGVFLPLLLVAALLLHAEGARFGRQLWVERLRFRRMNAGDWLWTLVALVLIGGLSAGLMSLLRLITGQMPSHPPFMVFEPLTGDRYWLLALWLPYWVLNIMGEEILWRAVILPRQEHVFGRWAWLINSGGWLLFHLAFGWQLVITLLPILLIEPYVVQRRQNTWIGVLIHALLNGPGFLAIAFGLI